MTWVIEPEPEASHTHRARGSVGDRFGGRALAIGGMFYKSYTVTWDRTSVYSPVGNHS